MSFALVKHDKNLRIFKKCGKGVKNPSHKINMKKKKVENVFHFIYYFVHFKEDVMMNRFWVLRVGNDDINYLRKKGFFSK